MEIYKFTGMNGKERFYTYAKTGNRFIYKERKKTFKDWVLMLYKLLIKAKYSKDDAKFAISYFASVRGYWRHENYYIRPCFLVQNLNDLGGVKNIEYV